MNIFEINLRKHIPEVIEIYSEIFGRENKKQIAEKINSAYYVYYLTDEGVKRYKNYLLDCKAKKLYVKYLRELGIDIPENDEAISHLIGKYVDKTALSIPSEVPLYGVAPFFIKYDNPSNEEIARRNKINFINAFRGEEYEEIDEWSFDEFCKSQEYIEFLKQIKPYYDEYKKIEKEYRRYEAEIAPIYDEYIKREEKRKSTFDDEELDYIYNSDEFKRNFDTDLISEEYKRKLAKSMLLQKVAVCPTKLKRGNREKYISIMLYTPRNDAGGVLDFIYLHEMCHIIGIRNNRVGFETEVSNQSAINLYNSKYRKYERLNETVTDMIAGEALEIAKEKELYFFENKKYAKAEGHKNSNTSEINKKILQPLYDMYRKEILEVMLTGDRQKFIEKIGTENFEEINDILNKVDYLVYEGLMKSLKKKEREKNKKENANVKEYKEQLKRLKKVYARIDEKNKHKNERENVKKNRSGITNQEEEQEER